jgi:beta-N-acetylhexosaminidase
MKTVKFITAFSMLLMALALIPFAWEWRSPFLADFRPWMLPGMIAVPLGLIFVQAWILWTWRRRRRNLRAISALGIIIAALALTITVTLEGRFQWERYHVLHADPKALERLGRHFILGYRNLAEIRELVRLRAVAGVFLSGGNVRGKSLAEVRQITQSFQRQRQEQGLPPLWIATDQEGGVVSRLSPPLTRLPSLSQIAQRYSDPDQREQAVREFAQKQGLELASVGVNLNFAPVVDLNYKLINPNDRYTRVYERAISGDPAVVTQVAGWYCAELEKAGVHCTLKHFPGLGRVVEDTHTGEANLTASLADLSNSDWIPFRALMRRGRPFTMLGHVRLTALDKDNPASMSRAVIAGLLRGDWTYNGVLITDNFSMAAVYRSSAGMKKGSIQALNAGVDLILISWDPDQFYPVIYSLLKADKEGRLDREALKRSVQRLEAAKRTARSMNGGSARDKR